MELCSHAAWDIPVLGLFGGRDDSSGGVPTEFVTMDRTDITSDATDITADMETI